MQNRPKKRSMLSDVYQDLKAVQKRFNDIDPSRNYSNPVGDLGEHFACEHYGLVKSSGRGSDAKTKDGVLVEIKTRTDMDGKIEIKGDAKGGLLLVFFLADDGSFYEVYYGPMKTFFENATYKERTKDYQLSMKRLAELSITTKRSA